MKYDRLVGSLSPMWRSGNETARLVEGLEFYSGRRQFFSSCLLFFFCFFFLFPFRLVTTRLRGYVEYPALGSYRPYNPWGCIARSLVHGHALSFSQFLKGDGCILKLIPVDTNFCCCCFCFKSIVWLFIHDSC